MSLDRGNPAFKRATEDVMKKLEATGVKVKVLTKEEAESELARLEELADMQKRTTPETESVQDEHQPSVVSSADGAKILKDLDSAIKEYDGNTNKRPNTFLGDVAKALGAKKHGSNIQYATFEAINGKVFTIRLANHNAKVSTFDNHNSGWDSKKDSLERIGNSFSIEDLKLAINANLAEIRIVTPSYTFALLRPKKGWPSLNELIRVYSQEFFNTRIKIIGAKERNSSIFANALIIQQHLIIKETSNVLKIQYLKAITR